MINLELYESLTKDDIDVIYACALDFSVFQKTLETNPLLAYASQDSEFMNALSGKIDPVTGSSLWGTIPTKMPVSYALGGL